MNTTKAGTVLDLFAGAVGAWSLGLHRAGFRTIAACEIDPWRRAIFSHNFPHVKMYDDVHFLTAGRLLADIGRLPDVIVGSPPCKDASAANTEGRGVDGRHTALFFEAIRIVGECRPRFCAFENSPRLRTRGYDRIAASLEKIGYAASALVVGADDLGAPHIRKRVWIVAADASLIKRGRPASDQGTEQIRGAGKAGKEPDLGMRQALDAASVGPGGGRAWRRGPHGLSGAPDSKNHPYTDSEGKYGQSGHGEMAGPLGALERMLGPVVHSWNGGAIGHFELAYGSAARLARIRVPVHGKPGTTINAARACIAAQGDAILPQIAEAIGRSILRVESALSALLCE